jgi:hypothetical protein
MFPVITPKTRRTPVDKTFMSDQDIMHFNDTILPLKEQFERSPYELTQTELNIPEAIISRLAYN